MIDMTNELLMEYTGGKFPRGLGNPYRSNSFSEYYIANSISDIEDFIQMNDETNCYISVYSYTEYIQTNRNKMSAVIDVIPFDFDSDDLECSFKDLKIILSWCKRHSIEPRVYFTSNKGFHLFLDIDPIEVQYPQQVLAKFGKEISKSAGLQTLDQCLFGDLERVMRLPNTKHKNTGLFCIALNTKIIPFLTIRDILKLSEEKSSYVPIRKPVTGEIHKLLYEYDRLVAIDIEEMRIKIETEQLKEKNSLFPGLSKGTPCVAYRSCISNGVSSGFRNYAAAGITQKCKKDGFTFDKTFKTLIEFGLKCEPVIGESELRKILTYHWKRDYSICTFFVKFCDDCICCVNRTF